MKSKSKLKISVVCAAVAGMIAGIGLLFAQNIEEFPGHLLFRVIDPQVRSVGTVSFRDRIGTSAAQVAHSNPVTVTSAATLTLGVGDCGRVIVGTASSGTQVFTLPAVTNTGCTVTFIAGNANGEILVNAASAVACTFTKFSAVGGTPTTAITTIANCTTGIKNTAATNAVADTLQLVSDGTQWLGVGITAGIWTNQP